MLLLQQHWQDLMYDRLSDKYGCDPRDDDSDSETAADDVDKPMLIVGGSRLSEITTAQFGSDHGAVSIEESSFPVEKR